MDKGRKTLDEIVEERWQVRDILNKESEEVSMFNHIESKRNMIGVILELEKWDNGTSKLNNTAKKEFLKFSIHWLKQALMYYSSSVKDMSDSETKAAYWKLKYMGVKSSEQTLDKLMEQNLRLIEENEELKKKYEKIN